MALYRAYAISILKHVIVIGEGLSKLSVLLGGPPIFVFDMFFAIGRGLGTWCSPCGSSS